VSQQSDLASEVQALESLDLEGLRAAWRAWGEEPPKTRSPELLRLALGWRMQAEATGGLTREARAMLRRTSTPARAPPGLGDGARLVREWRGVRHEVVAVDGGFRHRGQIYRSLSEVARAITGSRWNGPRFFGLRAGETQS
jgi:hypothetical protein